MRENMQAQSQPFPGLSRRFWTTLILVAASLRLVTAFSILGSVPLLSDASSYSESASAFVRDFPGHSPYNWPPGLPFVLAGAYAVMGSAIAVTRLVVIFFGVLTVVLTVLLTREVTSSRSHAMCAGWLAALYAPAVMMSGQSLSQILVSPCLLGVAYWTMRGLKQERLWYGVWAGVAFGLGCLTRPSMMSVGIIIVLLFLWKIRRDSETKNRKRILGMFGLMIITSAVIIMPVQWHNYSYGEGWAISTNNERNFFLGNNPYTPDYKTNHLGQRGLNELAPEISQYLESFYNRPDSRSAMIKEALRFIVEHPFLTSYRTLNRIQAFWGFDYIMSRNIQEAWSLSNAAIIVPLTLEGGMYCVVMVMIIVALTCYRHDMLALWRWWLCALVLFYQLPYAFAFSGGMYHFPVVWILMPCSAITLQKFFHRESRQELWKTVKRKKSLWVITACFFAIQIEYAYYTVLFTGTGQ